MKELLTEEFLDKATENLIEIANNMSNDVVGIIVDRLKECKTLTASDVNRLKNAIRIADFKKIKQVISEQSGLAVKEIERIFDNVAKENEAMAKTLYEYRDIEQKTYTENKTMGKIVESALKNAKEDFLALSNTTAMELILNGKATNMQKAYNKAIDNAVFALNQGVVDYTQAIRRTVAELSKNGLVVRYESGYRRRLDSAVRMNILDGCRQMSLSMREQQAKEYGADGWEISAHALCRPEHQPYQGRTFSFKDFDRINATIRTPIATGEMNCKHIKVGVIMEINEPAYSDKELKEFNTESNEKVKFTGLSGKEMYKTRYDCSQYMRAVETSIREMKNQKKAYDRFGDKVTSRKISGEITQRVKEYKRICKEMGISERLNRII